MRQKTYGSVGVDLGKVANRRKSNSTKNGQVSQQKAPIALVILSTVQKIFHTQVRSPAANK